MIDVNAKAKNQQHAPEPIAIIGMGCRFPGGANDWQSYWEMLNSGTDAITETPPDRWNLQKFYAPDVTKPGKTQSRWGGYVTGLDQFDPQLFGIAPREAAGMDPQQRLLLEVAYRAMEDAGHPSNRVAGEAVSVFVGISSFDYTIAGLSYQDRGVINAYSNTGGASSIAANRISYCFDLRGPSVAVDTACSSSLVAVHMACESIWRGEANMALAGGVNALIMPDFYVAFSQLGVMSPDGRCKTFDRRANGYVRSEGAGMVMLKPLAAAMRDKDPIYATIRATALNQDGRTQGMTVPSQSAQETLIRTACSKADIAPHQIQYVEAHGTGTPVGDPIEANALGAVLGANRTADNPCVIGSVKTNIGHLEAGAGIASLIKVALSMHHRTIPGHLHFETPNPDIDFERLHLRVPQESLRWDDLLPNSELPFLAGINGFGYGGANAHIIVEQAPTTTATWMSSAPPTVTISEEEAAQASPLNAPVLLPLSARSKPALAQHAADLADWIESQPNLQLAEIAGFLAHRRSHHECRTTACAAEKEDMLVELRAIAKSNPEEFAEDFASSKLTKGPVFVCSGQGPQWWGMGRSLLRYSPAFRSVIKRCDAEFATMGNWSLIEELSRDESTSRMQQTSIAQPSIFAIQVALASVWESWGIRPAAIVGHSVGEIAASYLSGGLSWEDACRVAFHRGRTMDLASSKGAMVAAGLAREEVPQWLEGIEDQVSLAAINGPTSVTISGEQSAIEELAKRLDNAGVFCRRLAVEYAFHSPQMEPVQDELLRSLAEIKPRQTHTNMISTVTGSLIDGSELGADYWWQNVRQSVRFSDAMQYVAKDGFGIAVEIGPHPVLAYAISECFQESGQSVRSVPSLNRQQDDLVSMSKSLGSLYSLGMEIDWSGFYNRPSRRLAIPTYPFQLQRCWIESRESRTSRLVDIEHPLLGERASDQEHRWQNRLDLRLQPYLSDHRVRGSIIMPAAALIEATIAASRSIYDRANVRLERFQLLNPCVLAEERAAWLETTFDHDRRRLQLVSRECGEDDWTPLATSVLSSGAPVDATPLENKFKYQLGEIRARCQQAFTSEELYGFCDLAGLHYGKQFRGVKRGQRREGEALVDVSIESLEDETDLGGYAFHPALLDSCFHAMIATDADFDHTVDGLFLPALIHELSFYRVPSKQLTVHARLLSKSEKLMRCDLDIYDEHGQLCISIRDFESLRVGGGSLIETTEDLIYGYRWIESSSPEEEIADSQDSADQAAANVANSPHTEQQRWLLFMDEQGTGRELAERLRGRGDSVVEVFRSESQVPQVANAPFAQVDPEAPESFDALLKTVAEDASPINRIVYLWGLDAPATSELDATSLELSEHLTTLAPMHLVQAWDRLENAEEVSSVFVTSGAQSIDETAEPVEVAQGALIGFARVIVSEYGKMRSKLVDLPKQLSAADLDSLLEETLHDDDEDEIMWRGGKRFVRRFQPASGRPLQNDVVEQFPSRLSVGETSGIEELHYETMQERTLAPGEVEIEVVATGLNFSDVMKALDLYPGLPDGPVALGAECAGRVRRTGDECEFSVGDEVIAVAPGAFGTHVVVNQVLVARKPQNLTFAQAAAIPIAFLTASYALESCARLRTGDRVLIHAASGGVGLAAMQIAKRLGVKIAATAGTDVKREFVTDYGADIVMNSRSLELADETNEWSNGEGVDAVLNSLPGEAIAKGLSVLRTGGRFLEIGKRDIYGDSPLGLYPFRNNLALFAIDLDQLFKVEPVRMGQMLRQLVEQFEAGDYEPLPIKVYPCSETVAAYRYMQQGKHIGKVIVNYERRPESVQAGEYSPVQFDADASYWIAGGLGGFGLEIARWMVQQGARSLVLSGRSATVREEAQPVLDELTEQGTQITVIPADITRREDVRRVLETIDRELPELKGIIHTAMVLEDKLLVDLDRPTLERVMRPKATGGWNLHHETRDRKLDHFVLFSSLSSVFGHAGQANYSAANAALDSLACYRRSLGLNATVINWGHLGEVGYLAEREELGQRLERQGVMSFSVRQATDCLEYALQTGSLQMSVLRMDWSVWRGLGITNRVSPRFGHLLRNRGDQAKDSGSTVIDASELRCANISQRMQLIDRMLRGKTGMLLGVPAEQVQAERALLEMGLDSLMAVEMRNWIEGQMEISIPISALMRSESIAQITEQISDLIENEISSNEGNNLESPTSVNASADSDDGIVSGGTNVTSTTSDISATDAEGLLEQLPDMPAEEVSQLLGKMLQEQKGSEAP